MDPRTDTDFIRKLDKTVEDGFAANSREHQDIMDIQSKQDRRFEQNERAIEALRDLCMGNEKISAQIQTALFGTKDGKQIGCQERQRSQGAFQKSLKRVLWSVATPLIGILLLAFVALAKHLLSA